MSKQEIKTVVGTGARMLLLWLVAPIVVFLLVFHVLMAVRLLDLKLVLEHAPAWIGAMATLIGALTTIVMTLRKNRRMIVDKIETLDTKINDMNSRRLREVKEQLDKELEFFGAVNARGLDIKFRNGPSLIVAIFPQVFREVMPGLKVCFIAEHDNRTYGTYLATGAVALGWHTHTRPEIVTVRWGTMQDMETGKMYYTGDTWEIPAGQEHSCVFNSCCADFILGPPALENCEKIPPQYDGIDEVLDDRQFIPPSKTKP